MKSKSYSIHSSGENPHKQNHNKINQTKESKLCWGLWCRKKFSALNDFKPSEIVVVFLNFFFFFTSCFILICEWCWAGQKGSHMLIIPTNISKDSDIHPSHGGIWSLTRVLPACPKKMKHNFKKMLSTFLKDLPSISKKCSLWMWIYLFFSNLQLMIRNQNTYLRVLRCFSLPILDGLSRTLFSFFCLSKISRSWVKLKYLLLEIFPCNSF